MPLRVKLKALRSLLFENTSLKQTIAKNTFWLGSSTVVGRLIKAALVIYAARILGASEYGVFSYALSLAALFSIFSDIGVGGLITREVSRRPDALRAYFSTGLVIKFVLAGICATLIILIAPSINKISDAARLIPIAALLVVFDGIRDFSFSITRAWEKMELEALIGVFTNVMITVIGLALLFTNPNPRLLLWGYTLGAGMGTALSIWVLRSYFYKFWVFFDASLVKQIFLEAWPFALSGLLGAIMINTDAIMLGWLKGSKEVGLYSAALRPVQLLYFTTTVIGISAFPSFAKYSQTDKTRFRNIIEGLVASSFMIAVPLFVGGTIVGKELLLFLYGSEYLASAGAFSILLFTSLTTLPGNLLINAVFAAGKQKIFITSLGLGAIGNVILNYFLIPPYGIAGAAIATVVAQVLSTGAIWITLKKTSGFTTLPHLKKIIPSSLIMGLLVWLLSSFEMHVLLSVCFGALAYFAILFFTREQSLLRFIPPSLHRLLRIS
ncbi:MAG: flippase [Patescibacteria group bacterium]